MTVVEFTSQSQFFLIVIELQIVIFQCVFQDGKLRAIYCLQEHLDRSSKEVLKILGAQGLITLLFVQFLHLLRPLGLLALFQWLLFFLKILMLERVVDRLK